MNAAVEVSKHFIALLERHQPKSPLIPTAYLYLCQVYEHFNDLSKALEAAEKAHKTSLAINGHGEETDDLEETAYLIKRRIERRLRDEPEEE